MRTIVSLLWIPGVILLLLFLDSNSPHRVHAQGSATVHLNDGESVTIDCMASQLVTIHISRNQSQLVCFLAAPIMTPTLTATATLVTPLAATLTPTAETPVLFPSPTATFTATATPTALETLSVARVQKEQHVKMVIE